jgi:hypothetical protein
MDSAQTSSGLGPQITLHIVAAVVTMASAVFLFRTAAGARYPRFLRHLGASVALIVLFRLGTVAYLLLKAGLEMLAGDTQIGAKVAASAAHAIPIVESAWHAVDITISLLASTFLFTTWDLLRRYPNEGVERSLFTWLAAFLGAGSLAVIVELIKMEPVQRHIWGILDAVDVGAATIGLVLVGYQLQRTLGPLVRSTNNVVRRVLPEATAVLYYIWGGIQPFYVLFRDSAWYDNLLLVLGVCALFMTIILCSHSLEERPGRETTLAGHG